ncbi:hypothetical protein AKJ51_01495 [candidate division MSBL1 archaeon SCGC-AAA382A20]|uniref:Uncharacterized protein n=1 Tax=candidate division MSBL1 archaeon SCGC-AAA382A20 TaxID=1698280 RepID=A0A133VLQ3_9EURY|nr:hypothetical protein AKJ51_01495 [candidate division MSBL1 archaeon SCGC-AAA382A20]
MIVIPKGWKFDSHRHSLASHGIQTHLYSHGKKSTVTVNEAMDIVRECGTYADQPHEVSLTLNEKGDILSIDEGDEGVVSSGYVTGQTGQIWFHNHLSDAQPPSLFDVYYFLDVDEVVASYVVAPNLVYVLNQNQNIPEISYESFRDMFHQLIMENETEEVQKAYESGDGSTYLSLLNKYMGNVVDVEVVKT